MKLTQNLLKEMILSSVIEILKENGTDFSSNNILEKLHFNNVDDVELEFGTEEEEIDEFIKRLKTDADTITMFDLDDIYQEELENGKKVIWLKVDNIPNEQIQTLNDLYDKINPLVKRNSPRSKYGLTGIYGIKNTQDDIQYFVRIPLGRNGAEHNFCNDYIKTLYEIYQILDEKSEWTSMTDASCDVCDDLYNFVVTFVLKK